MSKFEMVLEQKRIKYTLSKVHGKNKYTLRPGTLGNKISEIMSNITELSKVMNEREYAVLPVAKAEPYMLEIVFSQTEHHWRIVKGIDSIDIDNINDITTLQKILNTLLNNGVIHG